MSVRTYSRRPKTFSQIVATMLADAVIEKFSSQQTGTYSSNSSTTTKSKSVKSKSVKPKTLKSKTTAKKQKKKDPQIKKDISQTLEMIEKQLEQYGLTEEEIEQEMELIDEDEVEEQIISVQEQVCETIRNKVSNNTTMKIENEEILEDNSVVITISI